MKKILLYLVLISILAWQVAAGPWDVQNVTTHTFDTNAQSGSISLEKFDDLYYLATYTGVDYDGYAVLLNINPSTRAMTHYTPYEYSTIDTSQHYLVYLNDNHFVNIYRTVPQPRGNAIVMSINTTTHSITKGTAHSYDYSGGSHPTAIKVDDSHVLVAYSDLYFDGYAVLLTVNTTSRTITSGTKLEFDPDSNTLYKALAKIDDTHFLCTYHGPDADAYAVIFTVNTAAGTVAMGTPYEFHNNIYAMEQSLAKIDDTHFLSVYADGNSHDAYARILTVNVSTDTIQAAAPSIWQHYISWLTPAMIKIDDSHYFATSVSTQEVLEVDVEAGNVINISSNTYAMGIASLELMDSRNILAVDSNVGKAILITLQGITLPIYTTFTSTETTNFSDVILSSVPNLTLAIDNKGKIAFPSDHNVNAEGADYDTNVKIEDAMIFVNSSALDSSFNDSTTLTFEGVNCNMPYVYYSDTASTRAAILLENNQCFPPRCTNIQCSAGTLTVDVTHFSGYAVNGTANLTIDADDPKYLDQLLTFTAEYRNTTELITGATCTISLPDGDHAMNELASHIYNYSTTYATAQTVEYNVTCSKAGENTVFANDTALITGNVPEFSTITLGLGLIAVLAGLFIIRKKK
ncbi:MAG: hypothetical protein KAS15_01040 [Nanoarchaeota archaeon]|nr:hypothetical protein [Nanoarchaeota archaeon]